MSTFKDTVVPGLAIPGHPGSVNVQTALEHVKTKVGGLGGPSTPVMGGMPVQPLGTVQSFQTEATNCENASPPNVPNALTKVKEACQQSDASDWGKVKAALDQIPTS